VALKRKLLVIVVVLIVIVRMWRVTVGSDYGSQSIAVRMLLILRIVQSFHTSSSVAWRHWQASHSACKPVSHCQTFISPAEQTKTIAFQRPRSCKAKINQLEMIQWLVVLFLFLFREWLIHWLLRKVEFILVWARPTANM
jgi:disulfide bond formation protein DsbB